MTDNELKKNWEAYRATGDTDIRRRLAEHYLPLVEWQARKALVRLPVDVGVEYGDLVSAGMVGCLDAIDRFDLSRGLRFNTFASPRIRGAMLDWLRQWDWVSRDHRRKMQNGELPEISRLSLSHPIAENESREYELGEMIADDAAPVASAGLDREESWRSLLRGAERASRLIVLLYYREGLTLRAIGEQLGLSESRVSQIHQRVLNRMRDHVQRQRDQDRLMPLVEQELTRILRAPDPRAQALRRLEEVCGGRLSRAERRFAATMVDQVLGWLRRDPINAA